MAEIRAYDCPFCEKEHDVRVEKRMSKTLLENIEVDYEEEVLVCLVDDQTFLTKELIGKNLLSARDSYRKLIGRLTSYEIKAIRNKYNLNQKEFSNLLGWGDVTVQRYEKKLIQDETYDQKMRLVNDDPKVALDELEKHKDRFTWERYSEIRDGIIQLIKKKGVYFLKWRVVESLYIDFMEPCVENGKKVLDPIKIENMISFFAQYSRKLYKVKLMKLLWYADALLYKRYDMAMSGLVYRHLPLGAVPIAHEEILSMCDSSIKIEEELFGENIAYKIVGKRNADLSVFEPHEISVLHEIIGKFTDMTGKEISDYMHEEIAYKQTRDNQIIPFSLAASIRELS